MKNISLRLISLLLLVCIALLSLASCVEPEPEVIDYAASVTFDPTSTDTVKQEVTVKGYVDGDTTHFFVPTTISKNGVLKARYLGINTPESTGQIQEWGKKASNFTKEKLMSATSIYIESDDTNWNLDSTGARHLVWVWYKPEGSETYRNLNLEIMQEGLAVQSNSAQNRYGTQCVAAYNQAVREKLNCHSGQQDPDFYYGSTIDVTLLELRINAENYVDKQVAFTGIVAKRSGDGVYVEAYDEETGTYNGVYVYHGAGNGDAASLLKIGAHVRIVGNLTKYYDTYQVSDIHTAGYYPDYEEDTTLVDRDTHEVGYPLTSVEQFTSGKVTVISADDVATEYSFAEVSLGSSISFENLTVKRTSTTMNESSSNYMAFTLYCEDAEGNEITIRTAPLKNADKSYVLASTYKDQTINVKGIVEYYNPSSSDDDDGIEDTDGFYYQVKVLSTADLVIVE
ncbi:MAG: thermonuclease family protein [Clostridia bacterium]|nr:thermonuclease family protein [Clostridia bacterium]